MKTVGCFLYCRKTNIITCHQRLRGIQGPPEKKEPNEPNRLNPAIKKKTERVNWRRMTGSKDNEHGGEAEEFQLSTPEVPTTGSCRAPTVHSQKPFSCQRGRSCRAGASNSFSPRGNVAKFNQCPVNKKSSLMSNNSLLLVTTTHNSIS